MSDEDWENMEEPREKEKKNSMNCKENERWSDGNLCRGLRHILGSNLLYYLENVYHLDDVCSFLKRTEE